MISYCHTSSPIFTYNPRPFLTPHPTSYHTHHSHMSDPSGLNSDSTTPRQDGKYSSLLEDNEEYWKKYSTENVVLEASPVCLIEPYRRKKQRTGGINLHTTHAGLYVTENRNKKEPESKSCKIEEVAIRTNKCSR